MSSSSNRRKSALIVVDVQNDFINGSLSIKSGPAGQDAESIIDPINRLIDASTSATPPLFEKIVYSYDWHPENHISFIENVGKRRRKRGGGSDQSKTTSNGTTASTATGNSNSNQLAIGDELEFVLDDGRVVKQRVWPRHCVQHSHGAQLHPRLRVIEGGDDDRVLKIYKGSDPDIDSYSAFFDNEAKRGTGLHELLQQQGITDLYICGLAYDICVAWTAEDAIKLGYNTAVLDDCAKGLDVGQIESAKRSIRDKRGIVIDSDQVAEYVRGTRLFPWVQQKNQK